MLKTSRQEIVTVEKRKNVLWKVNVDEDIVQKCVATATSRPRQAYLGEAEGDFKQPYYNQKNSFRNRKYANEIS